MILGLDPAGPVFARRPRKARLDSSDARFVDVIHTSFNYLVGIMGRCGDVDFYVNGGGKQPGCWPKCKLISTFFWTLGVLYSLISGSTPYIFNRFISKHCATKLRSQYVCLHADVSKFS